MPFDEDPSDSRSELDMCIDEIKDLQAENQRLKEERNRLVNALQREQVKNDNHHKENKRLKESVELHKQTLIHKIGLQNAMIINATIDNLTVGKAAPPQKGNNDEQIQK